MDGITEFGTDLKEFGYNKAEAEVKQWSFPRDAFDQTVISTCMEWFGSFHMQDLLDTIDRLNDGHKPYTPLIIEILTENILDDDALVVFI